MAEKTLLQRLEDAARLRKLQTNSKESVQWFMKHARFVAGGGRDGIQNLLIKEQEKLNNPGGNTPIGKMYTYAYSALHADTLKYWDRFPLIFYVGPAKGGFYGINLHYCPPKARAILFDALMSVVNNTKVQQNKKLAISYQILKDAEKFKIFKPCFKHYLVSQLQTRVVEIPYEQWATALFLPTAQFEGAANSKVWSDTMLGVNK
jgi:hypothetical protein